MIPYGFIDMFMDIGDFAFFVCDVVERDSVDIVAHDFFQVMVLTGDLLEAAWIAIRMAFSLCFDIENDCDFRIPLSYQVATYALLVLYTPMIPVLLRLVV